MGIGEDSATKHKSLKMQWALLPLPVTPRS